MLERTNGISSTVKNDVAPKFSPGIFRTDQAQELKDQLRAQQEIVDELKHTNSTLSTQLADCQMQLKETQSRLNAVLPEAAKLQKALIENMRFRKQLKKPLKPDDVKYVEQNRCAGYTEQLATKVKDLENNAK